MSGPDEIARAARIIREGGLVAFPTETVYGLGANALNPAAVRQIFTLKGRPRTSPLIVHVDSLEMARTLVTDWPPAAEELARAHWPGPLTLVLPKQSIVPGEVTAGLPTVGVRMPAHSIALALIREAGVPIAAPSANRFTALSPTTAAHVRSAFGGDLTILDGGPTRVGIESTVVSLTGAHPVLLRPGMLNLGGMDIASGDFTAGEDVPHPAPGMHPRHYSPRTRLLLVDPGFLPPGRGAYIFYNRESAAARAIRMSPDPLAYAAALYSVLHELDRQQWDWIAVERPPNGKEWDAIHDRLLRAAQ
jgi:L-threonylcarbamoyladenylate synthase